MNEYTTDKQGHVEAEEKKESTVIAVNKNIKEFTSASGNKYLFQKVKPVAWLDIMDATDSDGGDKKRRMMYTAVVDNIIVRPQMKIEDFDEYAELDEVVTAAIRFQRGK